MIKATRKNCSLRSLSLVATLFFLEIINEYNQFSQAKDELYNGKTDNNVKAIR
ncbi:MAG: hypothetical protein IAX21_04830 [Candidatus Bathyarchaeota archaeon]|nr:MAG: hypothetical protein IAX21_04830 [Candidatus Bathyarchaeota archaeon]